MRCRKPLAPMADVALGVSSLGPVGAAENSQAFQRWVSGMSHPIYCPAPEGRLKSGSAAPEGRGTSFGRVASPSVETLGYSQEPLRGKDRVIPQRSRSVSQGQVRLTRFSTERPSRNGDRHLEDSQPVPFS
jgi:hypothetical protein